MSLPWGHTGTAVPQSTPWVAVAQEGTRPHSPKPRGCPPIRTIRHSSPVELVSSRSLGNLRGVRPSVTPSLSPQSQGRRDRQPRDGTYRFWVSASITMEM